MKVSWYRRTTEQRMKGMKVRSQMPLENANGSLPTGTIFDIIKKHAGLELLSEECVRCGLRLRISKVLPGMVGDAYQEERTQS